MCQTCFKNWVHRSELEINVCICETHILMGRGTVNKETLINQLTSDTLGAIKELKRDSMVLWPGVWRYFGWRDLPKAFLRRWRLVWDLDDTKQSPICICVWQLVVRFEVMVEEKLLGRGSSKLQMPWAWRAQGLVDLGGAREHFIFF